MLQRAIKRPFKLETVALLSGIRALWEPFLVRVSVYTVLMGHFPGKPGLAGCSLDSKSPVILILSFLTGQAETYHI